MKKLFSYLVVGLLAAFAGYQYGLQHSNQQQSTTVAVSNKRKPILTVAGIVYISPVDKVALIERGKFPFGTALFGGHVEENESPEAAFRRELREELNIDKIDSLELWGVHGEPGRDPRQHSVEITYFCTSTQTPKAGSDARSAKLYSKTEILEKLQKDPKSFAFDHGQILENWLKSL